MQTFGRVISIEIVFRHAGIPEMIVVENCILKIESIDKPWDLGVPYALGRPESTRGCAETRGAIALHKRKLPADIRFAYN